MGTSTRSAVKRVAGLVAILLAATGALLPAAGVSPRPATQSRLDLANLLDLYSSGRFDESIRLIQHAPEASRRELREAWAVSARPWIDADAVNRRGRILAVASLALEAEAVGVEAGEWGESGRSNCAPACVLAWARELLVERGKPDAAEHAWYEASIALGQGVRDARFLFVPTAPGRQPPGPPGQTDRALERFPDDPRFRLDRAMAGALRWSITTDGASRTARSSAGPGLGPVVIITNRSTGMPVVTRLAPELEATRSSIAEELAALGADPAVGLEAHVQLGYLKWTAGDDAGAMAEYDAALRIAPDPDGRYLVQFLRGTLERARRNTAAATAAFESALRERPKSQSATLALAALELQAGHAERADELARESINRGGVDDDPWRLFLYGRYPHLNELLKTLRGEVAR